MTLTEEGSPLDRASDASAPSAKCELSSRVLIVDDDKALCTSLQRLLRADGFEVFMAHNMPDGLRRATEDTFDLVVLDVMMPGGDGRALLKKLRAVSEVPVIMLTARGDQQDRISGLEAGADDYLPKPFNVRELVARMKAVLKRRVQRTALPQTIQLGDIEIHPATREVLQDGKEVVLTGAEFEILLLLVKSFGKVVSRDEIAEVCLGRPVGVFDRSVDNHVSNLRKKLGSTFQDKERIQSLRGTGYVYTGGSKP
ncbi:MAG: response regulator transcription factor [Acidobacteriaceae bacterium]